MKLIPSSLFPRETMRGLRGVNQGEKHVFERLHQFNISERDIALHSLNLTNRDRDRKRWHEVDFVIISCRGIFAIEVKGGTVSCTDGVWSYSGKQTDLSPAAQAKNNYFALADNYLERRFGRQLNGVPTGFGCIFTEQARFLSSRESALCEQGDEITAYEDEAETPEKLKGFLNRLADHWESKQKRPNRLDPETVTEIAHYLRPSFEKAPSLNSSLRMVAAELQQLTEEQYKAFDHLHGADGAERCVVTGGAGTGKSFLAMYAARLHAADGARTAFVTRNPHFSAFVRAELHGSGVLVLTPELLDAQVRQDGPFNVLVLDEAQDLCSFEALSPLGNALIGGIEDGRWNWFGDPNNQISASVPFDPEALQYWQSAATFRRRPLTENVRNTKNVIELVGRLTHADIGDRKTLGQAGEASLEGSDDEAGAARLLKQRIATWSEEGIGADAIAVLVPTLAECKMVKSTVESAGLSASILDDVAGHAPVRDSVIVAPVEVFKGLERPFVVAYGFWKMKSGPPYDELRSALYKSLTRANMSVLVIGTGWLSPAMAELIAESLQGQGIQRNGN